MSGTEKWPAVLGVALALCGGGALAWDLSSKDDPYSNYVVRTAREPIDTYCFGRKSEITVASHQDRKSGERLASIAVRLDGIRIPGDIYEAAVRGAGPLKSLGQNSGNVRCTSASCRLEVVNTFDVPAQVIAQAHKDGVTDIRVSTSEGERCPLMFQIPATVWSQLGFAPPNISP
jgi:hypothetical protein